MAAKTSLKHVVQDSHGKSIKVRSKLEADFATLLNNFETDYWYEESKVDYVIPESNHKYTVDFTTKNGIYWELKGWLENHAERTKYVLIKQQHPELDIRFVFANPQKLCGGTKMTHAKWAEKYEFPYCSIKDIETIKAWSKEKPSKRKSK